MDRLLPNSTNRLLKTKTLLRLLTVEYLSKYCYLHQTKVNRSFKNSALSSVLLGEFISNKV